MIRSNNTNKLSPQELSGWYFTDPGGSNNTNKLSPQEHLIRQLLFYAVQIIQINLALKNTSRKENVSSKVQIIQINLALKNDNAQKVFLFSFK